MDARDEMNALFDSSVRVALQLVEKHGVHMPFAIGLTTEGEIENIAPDDSDLPGPEALHAWVIEYVENAIANDHFRAIAVARNIEFTNKEGARTDAVEVTLDHLNDSPVLCYVPYSLDDGEISVGEVAAADVEHPFFKPSEA